MSRLLRALKDIPTAVNRISRGEVFRCVNLLQADEYIKTGYAESVLPPPVTGAVAPPAMQRAPIPPVAFPLDWKGMRVVVMGSGPSLDEDQARRIKEARLARSDLRIIAINTTFRIAPFADILYACDGAWWRAHDKGLDDRCYIDQARELFLPESLWTQDASAAREFELTLIRSRQGNRLSLDPSVIAQGMNSAIQAIGIGYHAGARSFILVGVDCKGRHWHKDHPSPLSNSLPHEHWKKNFAEFAKSLTENGVVVKNCSPGTALRAFPLADLTEELNA